MLIPCIIRRIRKKQQYAHCWFFPNTSSLEVSYWSVQYKQLNGERTASKQTSKLFVNASVKTVLMIKIFAQNPYGYAEHSLGNAGVC
jgi:hypothetical protein